MCSRAVFAETRVGGQSDIPVREGAGKRGRAGGGVLAGGFVAFLFFDGGFLFFCRPRGVFVLS